MYADACLCVAHVCWCVVATCRSFLPSGLCGGPLFGVIKVTLGFPVAAWSPVTLFLAQYSGQCQISPPSAVEPGAY